MSKKHKKSSFTASSDLQAEANTNGYTVLSSEFHNLDEAVAAASYQDAGIQTENIGTDTNLDNWQVKTAKNTTKGGMTNAKGR